MSNLTLEELFAEAEKYGRVRSSQYSDGKYGCVIEFSTVQHISLEAKSSFSCSTRRQSLLQAIEKAILIVESMHKQTANINTVETQRKLGLTDKIKRLVGV